MRIAITSRLYFPVIGGTPVLLRLLTRAFVELGHEVKLITKTAAGNETDSESFEIYRCPDRKTAQEIAEWSEVVFQIEAGLSLAVPFLLKKRPIVISHHTICGLTEGFNLTLCLQNLFARFNTVISVSESVRQSWGGHGQILGNCYDQKLFFDTGASKTRDLLFVGRLIPTKGVDVFLNALALLKQEGMTPSVSLIGDEGQAIHEYKTLASKLGLVDQVEFLGSMPPEKVAGEMRTSRILVVPSTWHEPFGIVALEGLASGCKLVASKHGGLPSAGGPFGHYFENGSASDLARAIREALNAADKNADDRHALHEHLEAHSPRNIAQQYVQIFQRAIDEHSNS